MNIKIKTLDGRRSFLKNTGCAALGTTTMWNTMLNLKTMNAAANFNSSVAIGGDYKALVCVLLGGGVDSFNMLMPTAPSEYAKYATTRTNLAVPNFDCNDPDNVDNIKALGDCTDPNNLPTHGVHPAMGNMRDLYNSGKLAFVSNVGTLIEPVNKPNLWNGSLELPLGLFSHIDQVAHWQTAIPSDRVATGWGGKMADLLIDANVQDKISMNMSFSGSNIFQTGVNSVEYALDAVTGSIGLEEFSTWESMEAIRSMAVNSVIDETYQNVFKRTYINTLKKSRDGHAEFIAAYENAHQFDVNFANENTARQDLELAFETIAKTVSVQSQLGMNRQIFFIEIGGWDHHDGLGYDYMQKVQGIDIALGKFQAALEEINMDDCVTTFSISEFARTLTSNGNGSDHAWGANMFVMGGAVNGGQIYGQYPSLDLGDDNDLEIGGGVLIPTLSADEYFTEIAKWFGVMNSDIPYLFPNISKFYDVNSTENPIGFLS